MNVGSPVRAGSIALAACNVVQARITMSTTPCKFVPTTILARFAGVDPRTAAKRLAAAKQEPDARLHDSSGESLLWSASRIPALVAEIQARSSRDELSAIVGRSVPTPGMLLHGRFAGAPDAAVNGRLDQPSANVVLGRTPPSARE